jgi:hypothetical protein
MQVKDQLEAQTWGASRDYLRYVLEHMLEAGQGIRELSEYTLGQFGADFLPYLRQFLHEVGQGRIGVRGLSHGMRAALSGNSVTSEERERMIREAAYLRAERRGFCGGSAQADWLAAEQEVDLCLAQGPGLVVSGGQALTVVLEAAREKPAERVAAVHRWLADRSPARPETRSGRKATPRTQQARSRAAPARRTGQRVKKTAGGKAAAGTPEATGTPAAKRTAATKKTAATRKAAVKKKTAATGKSTVANQANGAEQRFSAPRKKAAARKQATGRKGAAPRRGR